MKNSNKRVALQYATFAALFGLMCLFMDMMEETEEQTTYSITLEELAHGQSETNGETGGGGADGETGGGGTTGETGGGGTTGGTTGGGTGTVVKCDLCVVKTNGKVKYSCKPMQGEKCESPTRFGTSVSCNNAKEC